MRVFVDFVRSAGLYEAAREPSWVEADAPTRMLTAPGFLKSAGVEMIAAHRRLYHVERGAFLPFASFADDGVADLDTLVVVNSDDPLFDELRVVEALWQVTGGPERRLTWTAAPASGP
jgi:hypothetical protein